MRTPGRADAAWLRSVLHLCVFGAGWGDECGCITACVCAVAAYQTENYEETVHFNLPLGNSAHFNLRLAAAMRGVR